MSFLIVALGGQPINTFDAQEYRFPLEEKRDSINRRTLLFGVAGFALVGKAMLIGVNETTSLGRVLIAAGRRVDATDAAVARFPLSRVAEVRRQVRRLLSRQKPVAVVCSAACGADLIVLDVAGSLHIERYVLLPSEPEEFRRTSVTDRPGDWGDLYDRALKTSKVEILKLPEGQEGYLETNLRLLDRGQDLARKYSVAPEALVIWDKKSRGPDDVTGHFLEQAKLRKFPVTEIATVRQAK
jgi:hypothetical protein